MVQARACIFFCDTAKFKGNWYDKPTDIDFAIFSSNFAESQKKCSMFVPVPLCDNQKMLKPKSKPSKKCRTSSPSLQQNVFTPGMQSHALKCGR